MIKSPPMEEKAEAAGANSMNNNWKNSLMMLTEAMCNNNMNKVKNKINGGGTL